MIDTPDIRRAVVRGALIALAVAAVVGGGTFAAVMLITANLDEAFRAGGYLGVGYLALNLVVLVLGLIVRPSESWPVGAAVATPVILAAIGFGYTAYLAVPI
jgi:hypothetical protein